MNRLGQKIARLIQSSGPISVADYMMICLFDPDDGYYTTRDPFGAGGDFVTAPEVSQMFGELVAVWLISAWQAAGRPLPVTIAEIGPGRGTMMRDVIRTIGKIEPELASGASFALVEASPHLVARQKAALAATGAPLFWYDTIDALPVRPLLVACNELFDALPFRQFIRHDGRWTERCVALDEAGSLQFVAGTAPLDPDAVPEQSADADEGSIVEVAPAREALMVQIADRLSAHGGAGLFFDYGHLQHGPGDTFQAVRQHRYEGIFEHPGEADLTSHVDFAALAATARSRGLQVQMATQGDFLVGMGLLERAGRLGAALDEAGRAGIAADFERLAGPDGMGKLFKVMAISAFRGPMPGFGSAH